MKPFADLTRFINPRGIAVVGASPRESSQGRRLYENLALHSTAPGEVYPVNPAYEEIGGRRCWPSISDLPAGDIDVALVMVNAARVLDTLKQCVRRGIPYAVVMTSGFSEAGEEGRRLEREIAELCRDTGLHVYGPNCPGFVNVRDRIGMTFSPAFKDDLNSGGIGLGHAGRRAGPQPAARPVPWRRRGAVVLRRQRGRPGDSRFRRPHGGRSPDPRDRAADGRREGRPPPDRRPAAGARARQARGGAEGRPLRGRRARGPVAYRLGGGHGRRQ